MIVHLFDRQKDLKIDKGSLRALVKSTLAFLDSTPDEVSLYLVPEKKIIQLHDEFFNDPTSTDCISFPLDASHLGEIFVCPKTAIAYAKKHNLDPHTETALYIVHGLLHLLGYNDLTPADKRVMRKKEKSCMGHLSKLKIHLKPSQ